MRKQQELGIDIIQKLAILQIERMVLRMEKTEYKISCIGDRNVSDVHHIGIDYDGNYYSVVFGNYINGGFFSIPNWDCGGELSTFDDVFWNTESIYKSLKKKKAAKVIAQAIAKYTERE